MSAVELLWADDAAHFRRWESLVDSAPSPDVYYRPGYVLAHQVAGHGRAAAILVEAAGGRALLPVLLRPLSDLPFAPGTDARDAITPYGYGGLLPLSAPRLPPDALADLLEAVKTWCRGQRIVSLMLRLHPLFQQQEWFEPLAGDDLLLVRFGPTTGLDLAAWTERDMSKGRRSDLSTARKALRVTLTTGAAPASPEADLRRFRTVYEERMERLGAGSFYHFPGEYYAVLAEQLAGRLAVALAWLGEQPVGGALFLADAAFAHYHLSGTTAAGRDLKATTLLIRHGIEWARERGCRRLHLGGGARGDDPLFAFKKSFGGELYQYAFAGVRCDPQAYAELAAARQAHSSAPLRADFFPSYRS